MKSNTARFFSAVCAFLFLHAAIAAAQDVTPADASEEQEFVQEPPRIKDLHWIAVLVPRRNIRAGEMLTENDFDQVAVGFKTTEEVEPLVQSNFAVEGKYALVDLFKARTVEKGQISEQPPQTPIGNAEPVERGFVDELAWFSFEPLSPGLVLPGYRLQLKRIRRERIPQSALTTDFKPPKRFRVLRDIDPQQPITSDQIEVIE